MMSCSGSGSSCHTEPELPSRKERGITYTTANRLIRLRQQYPQINQLGEFGSVSVPLTRGRTARPRRVASPIWEHFLNFVVEPQRHRSFRPTTIGP